MGEQCSTSVQGKLPEGSLGFVILVIRHLSGSPNQLSKKGFQKLRKKGQCK